MIQLPSRKLIANAFPLADLVLTIGLCSVAILSITSLPEVSLKASAPPH